MLVRRNLLLVAVATGMLAACGPSWSPVEHPPSADNGYQLTPTGRYRVRRGDSLYTIAFRLDLDWRNLAEWNGIRAPYTIYPDQELRISPLPAPAKTQVVTRPARPPAAAASEDQRIVAKAGIPGAGTAATGSSAPPAVAARSTEPARAAGGDPGHWLWPTDGRMLSTFKPNDPSRNGIEIGGTEGQSIVAAAAGEVVYSGSGLIGYGELIIVKHSDRMLSAYAHNRKRLVAEGQKVNAGDRLAEMGRDDRNQPMLHFEIRVNGTPQDPMQFLPKR